MRFLKNIFRVAASNVISIISGLVVSFILPKILSLNDYGLYKTFTLYCSYLGVLSLGIIDGIVLKYGGNDYEDLNKRKFRSYFLWYTILHLFFTCLLILISVFVKGEDGRFIMLALAFYLISYNITGYYQQISQITQRFKEYSNRKIIESAAIIVIILVCYLIHRNGGTIRYSYYVIAFISVSYLLLLWYIITYKEISIGSREPLRDTAGEVISLAIKGFPLLFSNLCTLLILSLDRQFVSVLFTTEQYATYAFAYSMLSLVTVATSAISTVLYPLLKRMDTDTLKKKYNDALGVMLALVFIMCFCFFPLNLFIQWFLPKYSESLPIFRIILPGIAFSSGITVVIQNYYKVLEKTPNYFVKSIIVLILSALFNGIAYFLFKTREAISIASVITMLIWYVITDRTICRTCNTSGCKNLMYVLASIIVFYSVTALESIWLSAVLYIVECAALIIAFQRESIKVIYQQYKKK